MSFYCVNTVKMCYNVFDAKTIDVYVNVENGGSIYYET